MEGQQQTISNPSQTSRIVNICCVCQRGSAVFKDPISVFLQRVFFEAAGVEKYPTSCMSAGAAKGEQCDHLTCPCDSMLCSTCTNQTTNMHCSVIMMHHMKPALCSAASSQTDVFLLCFTMSSVSEGQQTVRSPSSRSKCSTVLYFSSFFL